MSPLGLLYLLAALLALASALHIRSWARKYILIRLFRRDDLPKLFGGTEFTVRTLRSRGISPSATVSGLAIGFIALYGAQA
jgi:hypothetical protein